ncbi:hypothetical protein [Streptomyces sp. NPDC001135]
MSESICSPWAMPVRASIQVTGVPRMPGTAVSRCSVRASIPEPPGTTTSAGLISCCRRARTAASPDFCMVSRAPTSPTAITIGATVAAVRRRQARTFSRTGNGPALPEPRSGPVSSRVTGRSRIGADRVPAPT